MRLLQSGWDGKISIAATTCRVATEQLLPDWPRRGQAAPLPSRQLFPLDMRDEDSEAARLQRGSGSVARLEASLAKVAFRAARAAAAGSQISFLPRCDEPFRPLLPPLNRCPEC